MQPGEEIVEQKGKDTGPQRIVVYVDELETLQGRRKKLAAKLRYAAKSKIQLESIIVFGSPATDADERINRIIAKLLENGTKVIFNRQTRTPPERAWQSRT